MTDLAFDLRVAEAKKTIRAAHWYSGKGRRLGRFEPPPPPVTPEMVARAEAFLNANNIPIPQPTPAPKPVGWHWPAIIALTAIFTAGFIALAAHSIGDSEGYVRAMKQERRDCLRREDRQFVDSGWFGSGEITVRNVCVEWRVTR